MSPFTFKEPWIEVLPKLWLEFSVIRKNCSERQSDAFGSHTMTRDVVLFEEQNLGWKRAYIMKLCIVRLNVTVYVVLLVKAPTWFVTHDRYFV